MNELTPPTIPTPPAATLLEWFEYERDEDGIECWALPSELSPQGHFVQRHVDDAQWRIMPVDVPLGSLSLLDALTYTDELARCIAACAHLNGQHGATTS